MDVSVLATGVGTAVIGFVGGIVQQRTSREARFEERLDKELVALRAEVALCRAERPQIQILTMGLCMLVPELQRHDPSNPVLRQVGDAFSALPKENSTFADLIEKLEDVPGVYDERPARQD